MSESFKAYQVSESAAGEFTGTIVERCIDDLPDGDVVVAVTHSSLNYKDALSASGNRGVTRSFPHTPGIDAAGTVAASNNPRFLPGDKVIVTGYDLGMNTAGGWGQRIRVPANWLIRCPAELALEDTMVFGTAGFTAALCVDSLREAGVSPDQGSVLVTGASGGVGMVAVWLLANLGYTVVAATGTEAAKPVLSELGATTFVSREEVLEKSERPMLKPRWAAAVDTVGGATLANVLKQIQYGGSVACCGMAGGADLNMSVFPFILRSVNLLGADSVELPLQIKQDIWDLLGGEWKFANFDRLRSQAIKRIGMADIDAAVHEVLSGQHVGRYLISL